MKLNIILRQLYEVTENLHRYVNSVCVPFKDGYLYYGKLHKNIEDIGLEERSAWIGSTGKREKIIDPKAPDNAGAIDFRDKNVDLEIAQYAKEYIIHCVNEFCKKYQDGDLQTLFIGCILNLYYSSGLFDRNGCLGVESIKEGITDAVTIQYIGVMENLMMKEVFSCFRYLYNMQLFNNKDDNKMKLTDTIFNLLKEC